jgi:hypothetical protein
MYMYQYELYKSDELRYMVADDFSAPAEMNSAALEDRVIRELNRKVAGASYEEHDKYNNVIDYSVKVYAHFVPDTSQSNAANRGWIVLLIVVLCCLAIGAVRLFQIVHTQPEIHCPPGGCFHL